VNIGPVESQAGTGLLPSFLRSRVCQNLHIQMPSWIGSPGPARDFHGFAYSYALPQRPHPSQHARPQADLGVYVAQMELNSLFANSECRGNRLIGPPFENQLKDFLFTRRQIRQSSHMFLLRTPD
jgi:hypothetical protein